VRRMLLVLVACGSAPEVLDPDAGVGTREVDLLLQLDTSTSSAENRVDLLGALPALVEVLRTGDVDGDGVADHPPVESLRVGVLDADLGSGGVGACAGSDTGSDGVLLTEADPSRPGCTEAQPPFVDLGPEDAAGAFLASRSCVVPTIGGGCGMEQPLEAILKALSPSTRDFATGTGHSDGANAGFLRDDALLVVLALTDENDCSAADPATFFADRASQLDCANASDALHPISRYVDGYLQVKSDPSQLLFALYGGLPLDVAAHGECGACPAGTRCDGRACVLDDVPLHLAAILSNPAMVETEDPTRPGNLVPSCSAASSGNLYPPTRLADVARGLLERGAGVHAASICADDLRPAILDLGAQILRATENARRSR